MTFGYLAEDSGKELLGTSHLGHKSISHDGWWYGAAHNRLRRGFDLR